jgi:hypothetical protein
MMYLDTPPILIKTEIFSITASSAIGSTPIGRGSSLSGYEMKAGHGRVAQRERPQGRLSRS